MGVLTNIFNGYKALIQLGFRPVLLNSLYRLGLVSGHYRRIETTYEGLKNNSLKPLFDFPSAEEIHSVIGNDGIKALLAESEEILNGKARLFGGEPVDLNLSISGKLAHWTEYETGKVKLPAPFSDIKMLWEPARFGWVFCLGRSYHLTGDDKYVESFWKYFKQFSEINPPYKGPNWTSGQEAALRLMAFVWAGQVFAESPNSTPDRISALTKSIASHAARIVPTFVYARSQGNNHVLTEAAGLLTAGLAIPDHPQSPKWCALGWKWLNKGLCAQIDAYGEYAQHSTNYHRLMLQVVLWVHALMERNEGYRFWPRRTREAIIRSIHWLLAIQDPETGQVPNLGANDGAYIFPLTNRPFSDYRPVLNAAARLFLEYDLPRGLWDEMALWFDIPLEHKRYVHLPRYLGDQIYGRDSWAYLRTAQFSNRPSHADQLHVDLWWHGLNIARDAGTYLYNAEPPWDNRLTTAMVHNTVTVNKRDQFTRAGRFLYLDWFNAFRRADLVADPDVLQRVQGRHWGYWKQHIRHERTISAYTDGHWQIYDDMLSLRLPWIKHPLIFRLHWLLPDWEWKILQDEPNFEMQLKSPRGMISLSLKVVGDNRNADTQITLVRAAEMLYGSGQADHIRGWVSPTYGVKKPALSLAVETKSVNEVQFISEFTFPQ